MEQRRVFPKAFGLVALLCALAVAASLASPADAARRRVESRTPVEFETPKDRSAAAFLPPEMIAGSLFTVRDRVACDGYMDRYYVESAYGVFTPHGDTALRKLLKEIRGIEVLKGVSKSSAYLSAVKSAGKMPLEFGESLLTDPRATIAKIPQGVARLFENVWTSATTKSNAASDPKLAQALSVSSYKRQYAAMAGVDVYSSNPVVQDLLNNLGWASAAGSLTVSAVTAGVGGAVVTGLGATRLSQQVGNLLREEPPARLREINSRKLANMGISVDAANAFLDRPHFTPRHQTIIVACLESLAGAAGREAFLRMAGSATDEETANYFQNMAETMKGYHEQASPIKAIKVEGPLLFARAASGSVLIPLPLDYGIYTERASVNVPRALRAYSGGGKGRYEMWVAGAMSPLAKRVLADKGVRITENVHARVPFAD